MPIEKLKQSEALIERVEQFLQTGYNSSQGFNEAFSGDAPVTFKSLKDNEHTYQFDASEVLFWVDRPSYLYELDNWNGEQVKESHAQALNYLDESNQLAVFADLVDLIRKRRIAPFIGAGLSKAAKYPLWGEALVQVSQRIPALDDQIVKSLIAEDKYLEAAQVIFDASEHQLINYVQTIFRTKYDSDEDRELIPKIFKLLPRLSSGCIVTTNFDCLIEEAFKLKGAPLVDGYMHGVQQGHNFVQNLLKGNRCILKLHGDAAQPSSYVFTEKQYESAYGTPINYSNQLPKSLRQIYISNSLLFLGCSLAKDRTLQLFKEVKDGHQFEVPDHFAILSDPGDAAEKQQTEDRLLDIKIRPIWYNSKNNHELATALIDLAVDVAERKVSLK